MSKKRGLSTIVATLIIILLTLVSVGIVWAVINNIIERGAEEAGLGEYTLDLQIKAAQIQDDNITVVVVRRNPGQGDFIGMNFVFSDGQNSEIIRENTSLQELEERSFTFTLTKISTANLKTVSVVPIFQLNSGRESIGNIADKFDVPANKSIVTGGAVAPSEGNFAKYGPVDAGRVEYKVSSGGNELPQFKKVIIDPLDVHVGENQTFTAQVYSPYHVTEVTTNTQLDNEVLLLPLEKISTDAGGVETWSATWIVYDTHVDTYRTTFTARDDAGNVNSVDLTWTDNCVGLNHGVNSVLLDNCTVSDISGLDTGNISIPSGVTLTLNPDSIFAWTPGYTIHFDGGKIALGGSLKRGYLFYYDADSDAYAKNSTLVFNLSSSLSGFVRAKNALGSGTYDCNDTQIGVQITRTPYNDSDNDTYTNGTGSDFCASNTTYSNSGCTIAGSDYAKNSTGSCRRITASAQTDCYDLNASAYPGQTAYFNQSRGDTSYDYDCNGTATKSPDSLEYQTICTGRGTGSCTTSENCPICNLPSPTYTATGACGSSYNDYTDQNCIDNAMCSVGSPCGNLAPATFLCTSSPKIVACH